MFLLLACTGGASLDDDGDGLGNDLEAALGTDPNEPDTDGDGLSDGDEHFTHGTDPTSADTDGDGYLDGWELDEGTDPNDASSVIYAGGWPYQPDKDALSEGAPTWDATSGAVGERLPRSAWTDQFGDAVDLYDFAGHDVPVMLALCATWSPECADLPGSDVVISGIVQGEVFWITVLTQDDAGNPPTRAVLEEWDASHGLDGVPVLAGDEAEDTWVPVGWPTLVLLDAGLTVESARVNSWADPLDDLESALSGE